MITTDVLMLAAQLPAQMPNPGGPLTPPGAGSVETLFRWILWGAFFCCIGGVALISGKMAIDHHQSMGGGQPVTQLWKPLGAAIVLSNITLILAGLVTWA